MLRVQHLIDVTKNASLNHKTELSSHLRQIINLLSSEKAPDSLAPYLAVGNPVALMKIKEGGNWDVRPIAVVEVLHRLTGKCLPKPKPTSSFSLTSMVWHALVGLRKLCSCFALASKGAGIMAISLHWKSTCKRHIMVSWGKGVWGAFPWVLHWVSWCYNQHPFLWHTLSALLSADGVQQGDPRATAIFTCAAQTGDEARHGWTCF